jgi:cellulose synthase/poly-beta-1,6-N-acetylglucosamine synthase-like glycosyltransferase
MLQLSPTEWLLSLVMISTGLVMIFFYWRWFSQYIQLFSQQSPSVDDSELPRVGVILTLRGDDPYLDQTLPGLFQQDYPDYEIMIVLDRVDDPASVHVNRILAQHPDVNCHVHHLVDHNPGRSLKLSAILEGLQHLSPETRVISIIDADAQPNSQWLKELIKPLLQPGVGATSGIRWFIPEKYEMGMILRQMWNLYADVQMHTFGIPWGGSLACRRELFEEPEFETYLRSGFSEDTSVARALIDKKLKLVVVPKLVMVNREAITLSSCISFIRRQFIVARLHHPYWNTICLWNIFTFFTPVFIYSMLFYSLMTGWIPMLITSFVMIVIVQGGMRILFQWLNRVIFRQIQENAKLPGGQDLTSITYNETTPPFMLMIVGMYLTICVTLYGTISAHFARRVSWRGIDYRIRTDYTIEMVAYHPYLIDSATAEKKMSI